MIRPAHLGGTLRTQNTVGRYRVETWEERQRFRVEVHHLRGRSWFLVRGPFWRDSLAEAEEFAMDVAESLKLRARG